MWMLLLVLAWPVTITGPQLRVGQGLAAWGPERGRGQQLLGLPSPSPPESSAHLAWGFLPKNKVLCRRCPPSDSTGVVHSMGSRQDLG